ncbi:AarF/UbiB family protein [Nonomuraea rosea]|uniref:AarF/UbiB family protein n=1 Tax=Nonomuraea rosea TaxID=638574 RepID=A0ABP6ZJ46_9ACTN
MTARRMLEVAKVLAELLGARVAASVAPRREGDCASAGKRERARAVRLALERLGPFYVKVGQMLSTRPDFVSEEIRAELAKLHDQVTSVPFELFEPMLAAELGPDWERRFERIERGRPLGSASLAQTYEVVLPGGAGGVLKIQRPDVRALVLDDMAMMRRAARLVAKGFPGFNAVMDVESALGAILDSMEAELDFTVEAVNMDHARELTASFDYLDVPDVITATPRVLVQSLAPGRSIREIDRDALTEKERVGIGRDLLAFMYQGYFVNRYFHADPHPGNILVAPGERAHLIDWGMVGRLDRRMSMTLLNVLLALAHNDGPGVARAWVELGRATPGADITGFAQDMAGLVPKIASASLKDLDFGLTLTSVLKYATRRGIQTAPIVPLVGKSFSNMEGSVRYLAPELVITDVFQEELRSILFTLARESMSEIRAARTVVDLLIGHELAPEQVRGLLRDVSNRELTLRVATLGGRAAGRRTGDRMLLGAAVAAGLWWWSRTRNT